MPVSCSRRARWPGRELGLRGSGACDRTFRRRRERRLEVALADDQRRGIAGAGGGKDPAERVHRGPVAEEAEVGSRHSLGPRGKRGDAHRRLDGPAAEMHREDRRPCRRVRLRHLEAVIEPARSQQRGIQHVRPVGGGNHPDVPQHLDAVELGQELADDAVGDRRAAVEAALRCQCVDLVEEHDAGRGLAGAQKQLAHAALRLAHVFRQ
jgi:hypothetical protein